jgi:hypothetical protein
MSSFVQRFSITIPFPTSKTCFDRATRHQTVFHPLHLLEQVHHSAYGMGLRLRSSIGRIRVPQDQVLPAKPL